MMLSKAVWETIVVAGVATNGEALAAIPLDNSVSAVRDLS